MHLLMIDRRDRGASFHRWRRQFDRSQRLGTVAATEIIDSGGLWPSASLWCSVVENILADLDRLQLGRHHGPRALEWREEGCHVCG